MIRPKNSVFEYLGSDGNISSTLCKRKRIFPGSLTQQQNIEISFKEKSCHIFFIFLFFCKEFLIEFDLNPNLLGIWGLIFFFFAVEFLNVFIVIFWAQWSTRVISSNLFSQNKKALVSKKRKKTIEKKKELSFFFRLRDYN